MVGPLLKPTCLTLNGDISPTKNRAHYTNVYELQHGAADLGAQIPPCRWDFKNNENIEHYLLF